MADMAKTPPKALVANPYIKKATPERQLIPAPAAATTEEVNTNPETPHKINPYIKNVNPATSDAKANNERRAQSLEKQEPNKKARLAFMTSTGHQGCIRCGGTDENTLCILWNHEGEIERERSYTGWDNFRWSCCGRLSPSCCFVGRHEFSGSSRGGLGCSRSISISISCNCHNGPAKLLCTRKDTSNCGRYFFKCSGNSINECDFFMWADKAFNLPYRRRLPAKDGVKEWIHIYANPFDQDINWMESTASLVPKPLPVLRERLIAAMIMHKCSGAVTGGWVNSNPQLPGFIAMVEEVFKVDGSSDRNSKILKELYPLSQVQITNRFGVSFQEDDPLFEKVPTFEECQNAFSKACKENSVLRSCGVKVEPFTQPTSGQSTIFISLEGLENYLAC
ncbi:hypothetical protein ACHAWO_006354 [Cyclotella atomus]|uniref:GRF-type domain-containing protein n=1 Tax=Cyclotella atomus TaxID=382360 RepID=A0ABD3N2G6_9STRA